MSTIKVATQAQLSAAMNSAKAGDTILLANGSYGKVSFDKDYTDYVTIKAENAGKASLEYASFNGSHGALDGVKVTGGVWAGSTDHVKITNSTVTGTVNFRYVDTAVLENNDMTPNGQNMGLLLNSVQNFTVRGNTIHDAVEDVMRITGDSNGLLENNVLRDVHGTGALHCDLLQMFGANGKTPHDITIRGNIFYDDTTTGSRPAQGIFMSDAAAGGYKNILIEDNLIASSVVNSIYVNGGQENVVIRNNTLVPSAQDGGGIIRLANKSGYDNSGTVVENNVFKELLDETKSSDIGKNVIYGKGNADDVLQVSGKWGDTFQDFMPKKGSAADFGSNMGALDKLAELMKQNGMTAPSTGGTTTPTTPVKPAPAPVEPTKPVDDGDHLVFSMDGDRTYTGVINRAVINKHEADMQVKQGSIALSFNADTTGWNRGLVSKDAGGTDDGISAWINNGVLKVGFEHAGKAVNFDVPGIKAKTDYDMLLTFGDGNVKVWLNGSVVAQQKFDMDLSQNKEAFVVGGWNAASAEGTTNYIRHAFDGTISDVKFFDTVLGQNKDGSLATATMASTTAAKTSAASSVVADSALAKETADTAHDVHEVFSREGSTEITGVAKRVVTVDHDAKMELDEGTIAFDFNADTTGWRRGLVSKDSGEDGHEFSSWIQDGKLIVQFQNDDDTVQITKSGIKANKDYEFMATFDEDHVQVFLDGKLVGEKDFHMDLSQNTEHLQIGGVNFSEHGETNDVRYAFDGHISDVSIYDAALTVEELHDLQEGHTVTHTA